MKNLPRYLQLLEEEFTSSLSVKTGWGRNEVIGVFKSAQVNAMVRLLAELEEPKEEQK